jgi:alkaline phosphatase
MDSWIDRNVYPENLQLNKKNPDGSGKSATDMPGLESMVMKAINILSTSSKCSDGFFLMAEAAAVDKQMHNMDYDRSLGELLELDRTVKKVQDWAKANGDNTGIMVTADHSQAFDVYGTVDTKYFNSQPLDDTLVAPGLDSAQQRLQIQKRLAVGVYENAGWPNLVVDENGMPTKWDSQYRFAQGKVDKTPHRENFQLTRVPDSSYSPMSRILTVEDPTLSKLFGFTVSTENPKVTEGIHVGATTNSEMTNTVHSMQAVDLYCGGPAHFSVLCAKIMDNTEVFFIMSRALGLGATGANAQVKPMLSAGSAALPSLLLLILALIH